MTQRVGLLNGTNYDYDKDYSRASSSIISEGVVEGLVVTATNVTAGFGLIEVTRTSSTPNETFLVVFENTDNVTIAPNNNDYIYIEVEQANINDGSSNAVAGTGIGTIKTGASLPASNYIVLAEKDGGGSIVTTNRTIAGLKSSILNSTDLTILTGNITTTGDITANAYNGDGSALTGVSAEINGLTEDTTGDMDLDYIVKYDGANKKILINKYRATDGEATTGTATNKFITPKQAKDNYEYRSDVVIFTRDISLASGTQAVSHGLGVVPRKIDFEMYHGTNPSKSSGSYTAYTSANKCIWQNGTSISSDSDDAIRYDDGAGTDVYQGDVSASSTTDFTVNWVKTGLPTGTIYVKATLTY